MRLYALHQANSPAERDWNGRAFLKTKYRNKLGADKHDKSHSIRVWLSHKAQKATGTGGDRNFAFGNENSTIAHQWPGIPKNNTGWVAAMSQKDLEEFEDDYAQELDNSDSEFDPVTNGKTADTELLVDADVYGSSEEDIDWEP